MEHTHTGALMPARDVADPEIKPENTRGQRPFSSGLLSLSPVGQPCPCGSRLPCRGEALGEYDSIQRSASGALRVSRSEQPTSVVPYGPGGSIVGASRRSSRRCRK
jgi:hypothetical protein